MNQKNEGINKLNFLGIILGMSLITSALVGLITAKKQCYFIEMSDDNKAYNEYVSCENYLNKKLFLSNDDNHYSSYIKRLSVDSPEKADFAYLIYIKNRLNTSNEYNFPLAITCGVLTCGILLVINGLRNKN